VQRVLENIKTKPLPRAFLVHGPETAWHEAVFKALREKIAAEGFIEWNWSLFIGTKDFDETPLLTDLAAIPWGGTAKIAILKEAHLIPAATMDKVAQWLENHPKANCLAVFLPRLDRRLKYVKTMQSIAWEIECLPLQGERLVRYVQDYCLSQSRRLQRPAVEALLARTGSGLFFIHNELDKLIAATEGRDEITRDDVLSLTSLSPAQIAGDAVFRMTDFLAQRKRREALEVLDLLLAAGESPLRILPLLERHLRLLLAAKTRTGSLEKTARQMGESSSYALQKIQAQAKKHSMPEIFAGFSHVVYADREMKLGAAGDQILRELIVKLT